MPAFPYGVCVVKLCHTVFARLLVLWHSVHRKKEDGTTYLTWSSIMTHIRTWFGGIACYVGIFVFVGLLGYLVSEQPTIGIPLVAILILARFKACAIIAQKIKCRFMPEAICRLCAD